MAAAKNGKASGASKKRATKSAKKPAVAAKLSRYLKLVAKNTPSSLAKAGRLLHVLVDTPITAAEKAYFLIHNWRNGIPNNFTECTNEFGLADTFQCAHAFADRSIALAHAASIDSPYGYWAKAYVYKYQRRPLNSAFFYQLAAAPKNNNFPGLRKRRQLMGDWAESQVYWLPRTDLSDVIAVLDEFPPTGPAEHWIHWVRCFAYHMMGQYIDSINAHSQISPPVDPDTGLIMAANYFRLGNDALRVQHKTRFFSKPSNVSWNANIEQLVSPFADPNSELFWFQSVQGALA